MPGLGAHSPHQTGAFSPTDFCEEPQKQNYTAKVKTWLEKPEQADLVKSIKATISPNMAAEKQDQVIVTQAKNFIRNTGIKLG